MAKVNGHSLTVWETGDRLVASDLNRNFGTLAERIDNVSATARQPDPVAAAVEVRTLRLEARLAALEDWSALQARQRNEHVYAPLSYIGAVLQRIDDLQRIVEAALKRLEGNVAALTRQAEIADRRLQRFEQQPVSATQEDFLALKADHQRLRELERTLLVQTHGLRAEVAYLRKLAEGSDREANRKEYAPLAYIGHILERLGKIEDKLK